MGQNTLLAVGKEAPDFCLPDQNGEPVCLHDLLAKGWVVIFFYPKDHTPVCTSQACAFRNAYTEFKMAGTEIIGISKDPPESHQGFAKKHQLPFRLLSDTEDHVRQLFGVPKTFGFIPGRATFVIDPQRIVRMAFPSQFNARAHMDKALHLIKKATLEQFSSP